MDKPISSIMTKSVRTANTEDTLDRLEELLIAHRISSVPIIDAEGKIFGIISAADLLRLHSSGKNLRTLRAWEACTYKPIEVSPATPARDVARLMVKNKIHHIIVAENKSILGFVSSYDFVEKYVLGEDA